MAEKKIMGGLTPDELKKQLKQLAHEYIEPEWALEYIAQLEEQLQEHDDYYRKVVDDECAPDEVHCTCVPALRKKLAQLEKTR